MLCRKKPFAVAPSTCRRTFTEDNTMNSKKKELMRWALDLLLVLTAGAIVGAAYFVFQNSNGFAPGGVGGLATITYHLCGGRIDWSLLMLAFNLPIFVLVSLLVNQRLGLILSLYLLVQSLMPHLLSAFGVLPYSASNNPGDFNLVFACLATGAVSGVGFSLMLRRFGASGGTYGISALLKRAHPELNVAYVSLLLDASVVLVAFFVYGMRVTPAMCTLLNLFVANIIVDTALKGVQNGYRFEIVTSHPDELSCELLREVKHGVTRISVHGMYADTDRYMLVTIVNKRQIGQMMQILRRYPDTFASFERVNEVLGNFKRKV